METPQIRNIIVASELEIYNVDITALSKVGFSNAGSIRKETKYKIFWSSKPDGEVRSLV